MLAADADVLRKLLLCQTGVLAIIKVWWRCPKGHSYRAAISSRAGGRQQPHGKTALRLSHLCRQANESMYSNSK